MAHEKSNDNGDPHKKQQIASSNADIFICHLPGGGANMSFYRGTPVFVDLIDGKPADIADLLLCHGIYKCRVLRIFLRDRHPRVHHIRLVHQRIVRHPLSASKEPGAGIVRRKLCILEELLRIAAPDTHVGNTTVFVVAYHQVIRVLRILPLR